MDELRHLQLVILEIVKDIDDLCKRNHINYYLNGGSAIGAIRHQGFIPWDDDFDIMMLHEDYKRFIEVCHTQLDTKKYFLQEGLKSWPSNYTKLRLRGTSFGEVESFANNEDERGIFVDIFPIDNVADNGLLRRWQYACAKYRICYHLSQRTYKSASWQKKLMIALAFPQRLRCIRNFFTRQAEQYNDKPTTHVGAFYGTAHYKNCIYKRTTFGTPKRVKFEDMMLPVPEDYDNYLTITFGDYMTPPPLPSRVSQHVTKTDFGKY